MPSHGERGRGIEGEGRQASGGRQKRGGKPSCLRARFSRGRLPPAFPPPFPTVSKRPLLASKARASGKEPFSLETCVLVSPKPLEPLLWDLVEPGGWFVGLWACLFVIRAPAPDRVGLKRLTVSKQRASQVGRKPSACKGRLLFSGRREARAASGSPRNGGEGCVLVGLCLSSASGTGSDRSRILLFVVTFTRHPWSFLTVKGNPSSSVEDHIEYHGNKQSARGRIPSRVFLMRRPGSF